jgi:hypothetical protein
VSESGPTGEVRAELLDDDLRAFLFACRDRTAAEFGKRADGPLPLLEWGEQPEYRAGAPGEAGTIFLSRHGHDWWQVRYQLAHEVFHWLCSPPPTKHWTHEALAVETAVACVAELGDGEYARTVAAALRAEAELLPVGAMLTARLDLGSYPPGLYGRAWVTCRELIGAVGWERLKPLASSFDDRGRPDVAAWLRSLEPAEQVKVEAVLGPPSPEWA